MYCCHRNTLPNKTVTLTFNRRELLYDIGNYSWVEGDVMKVEDEHERHPVIDAAGTAREIARRKGWAAWDWAIGPTHEVDESYHWIPFRVAKKC